MAAATKALARPAPEPAAGASNALALLDQGKWLGFLATYEQDFSRVAPAHIKVEAFLGLAAAQVRRDPKLAEAAKANPASLVLALRECAALGHLPMRGSYALVPFNNHKAPGGKEVVGIEEYRAVIERMYRAGGVVSVHVELVREADRCRFQRTRMVLPDHDYDEYASDEERGPLRAVYAWARLIGGGTSQVAWLPRAEVLKHRVVSKSGDSFWGPDWPKEGPWTGDMWRKTGLHVLERFVPTSAAYRWEVAMSEAAGASGFAGVPDRPVRAALEVREAELVEEEVPGREPGPMPPPAPAGAPEPAAPAAQQPWPEVAQPGSRGQVATPDAETT